MRQDSLGNTTGFQVSSKRRIYTSIHDLPTEVLINIFENLSPLELRHVRLVCRKWNSAASSKSTWIKAFDNRLGTGNVFASVTRSSSWLSEYFGRMAATRQWAKARAYSRSYQLVSDSFDMVNYIEADFEHDRLLSFSRFSGSVAFCTMTSGKNQVFVPGSRQFAQITAFDNNWNYSCIANANGELFLKNLITATASSRNQTSVKVLAQLNEHTVAIRLNHAFDKQRRKLDIVTITSAGVMYMWNLEGVLLHKLDLGEPIIKFDTDFKMYAVAVSATHVYIINLNPSYHVNTFNHDLSLATSTKIFGVDFHDNNLVVGNETMYKVFHFEGERVTAAQGTCPEDISIIDGTLQESEFPRNRDVAGDDGRLYALTFSDGSVGIFNIRDLEGPIQLRHRIMPFNDNRTPQGLAPFTKVALNSSVVAIGALSDWIHFYDAHSGKYLREGIKMSRKLTRHGATPISKILFGPSGACGVVVSSDLVQFFRFGEDVSQKKKPNAPSAPDLKSKKAVYQHIKSQRDDYDHNEYQNLQQELLAEKYNGTNFENEQEELRVALALSASCAENEDEELEKVLAASEVDYSSSLDSRNTSNYLCDSSYDGAMRETSSSRQAINGNLHLPSSSSVVQRDSRTIEDEEEKILKSVLELSLIDH